MPLECSQVAIEIDIGKLVAPAERQMCPVARLQLHLHASFFTLFQPLHEAVNISLPHT